jgi:hypothetical protein
MAGSGMVVAEDCKIAVFSDIEGFVHIFDLKSIIVTEPLTSDACIGSVCQVSSFILQLVHTTANLCL